MSMATTALTTPPSRRRFLLATGSAAVVGATITALDPTFAAIERHRALELEFSDVAYLTDSVAARQAGREITDYDELVVDRASQSSSLALNEFLATVPQTKSGCRAAIAYFAKVDWSGEFAGQFMATLLKSPALAG